MKKTLLFILTILFLSNVVYAEEVIISDDIEPYNGMINANNFFYNFKLFYENMNVAFTFNETKRLEKQSNYAQLRLSEIKTEMLNNRTQNIYGILYQYQKQISNMNQTMNQYQINISNTNIEQKMLQNNNMLQAMNQTKAMNNQLEMAIKDTELIRIKLQIKQND